MPKCCDSCYLYEDCENRDGCCQECDFFADGECSLSEEEPQEEI